MDQNKSTTLTQKFKIAQSKQRLQYTRSYSSNLVRYDQRENDR